MPDDDAKDAGRQILDAVGELAPTIRAAAEEIETGRRLPIHIVDAMKRAGVFRMAMPKAWGGPELDFPSQLRVLEALSAANGSVGWCAMIGIDGGYMTAFIDQTVAREMYCDIDSPTAITFAPPGKADKVRGGFRVTGRWPFASGCQHAAWLIGHFAVIEDGSPRMQENGFPETRFAFVAPDQCEIIDTWTSIGLRGSGSHDWSVTDRFVPEERTFNLASPTFHRKGPLNLLPNLLLYKTPAVALGIARCAIDEFTAMAAEKPLTFGAGGDKRPMLRDEGYVQSAVAQAEALVSSARGFVFEAIGDLWSALMTGERPSLKQRARARLAMVHANAACTQAVEILYKANGGASVYARNIFERLLRDIQTTNQHTVVSLKTWEVAGRVLLGLPPNHGLLF